MIYRSIRRVFWGDRRSCQRRTQHDDLMTIRMRTTRTRIGGYYPRHPPQLLLVVLQILLVLLAANAFPSSLSVVLATFAPSTLRMMKQSRSSSSTIQQQCFLLVEKPIAARAFISTTAIRNTRRSSSSRMNVLKGDSDSTVIVDTKKIEAIAGGNGESGLPSQSFLTSSSSASPSSVSIATADGVVRSRRTTTTTTYTSSSLSTLPPAPYYKSSISLEEQIVQAGRQGQIDRALQLFQGISSSSSSSRENASARMTNITTITSSSTRSPTIREINAILDACARAHPVRLELAFDMFRQFFEMNKNKNQYENDNKKNSPIIHAEDKNTIQKTTTATTTTTTITRASESARQRQQQQQQFSSTQFLKPNVYTFGALLSGCARVGNIHRARYVLDVLMPMYQVKPNAVCYNSAITASARCNPPNISEALILLQQAQRNHATATVIGYNAAISAAAKLSDIQTAQAILYDMRTIDTLPKPDAVTYGTIMSVCESAGEWHQLLDYAQQMQQDGYKLDGMAWTSTLHACQQLGLAERAMEYLELMKTACGPYEQLTYGRQVASGGSRTKKPPLIGPDAVAYRLAISACARGGAWKDGIRLLQELEELDSDAADVVAYTAAINGCEYAGEWQQAFLLLDRMRKRGVNPNEVTFTSILGACANACAQLVDQSNNKKGNMKKVLSEESLSSSSPPPLLPPQEKALRLLNVLKRDSSVVDPNIQVYNAAIRVCAEALDLPRCFKVWKMLQQQEEGSNLEPNVVTYGTLMMACERVGSVKGVDKVFKGMKEGGIEPNEIIYGAAISTFRKAGDSERAFALLREMILTGLKPNIVTYNTVFTALLETRPIATYSVDRAMRLYTMLKTNVLVGAPTPNRQTYNILIRSLAANQQAREAEILLRRMRLDGFIPEVELYTATVAAYERTSQPLRAIRLMESMRADGYDFYDVAVLNVAFKKAVALVNAVGQGLTISTFGTSGSYEAEFPASFATVANTSDLLEWLK